MNTAKSTVNSVVNILAIIGFSGLALAEMAISEKKIYFRTGDTQTVYLKSVITDTSIQIGEYTIYNDFIHDPRALVTKDVPLYTIAGGIPAKQIRKH